MMRDPMTFEEFDEFMKTDGQPIHDIRPLDGSTMGPDFHRTYAALGLAGEAGEVIEIIKKSLRVNADVVDRGALALELADTFWYLNRVALLYDIKLEEIVDVLQAKIKSRRSALGKSPDLEHHLAWRILERRMP